MHAPLPLLLLLPPTTPWSLAFLPRLGNETTHRYYLCLCERNWNDWYFGQYCKTSRVCLYWLRWAKSTCKPPSTTQLGKIHNRNRNELLQYFMIKRKLISLICHRKLDDSYRLYHGFLKCHSNLRKITTVKITMMSETASVLFLMEAILMFRGIMQKSPISLRYVTLAHPFLLFWLYQQQFYWGSS